MASRLQQLSVLRTIFRLAGPGAALALLLCSSSATGATCELVQRSLGTTKAAADAQIVLVAVEADDSRLKTEKLPAKAIKKIMTRMLLDYCKEYSGFRNFEVSVSGGVTDSIVCDQRRSHIFWLKRNNITIREVVEGEPAARLVLPDLQFPEAPFGDFQ